MPCVSGLVRRMTRRVRELSPRWLAEEHHILLRYLHKRFRAEGTTFGGWVRARRLSECRAEVARHDAQHLAISAVAARWGFTSPAHFSHAFRAEYGQSPSQWCRSARAHQSHARP